MHSMREASGRIMDRLQALLHPHLPNRRRINSERGRKALEESVVPEVDAAGPLFVFAQAAGPIDLAHVQTSLILLEGLVLLAQVSPGAGVRDVQLQDLLALRAEHP